MPKVKPEFGFHTEFTPLEEATSTGEVLTANYKLGIMRSETLSVARMLQSNLAAEDNDITQPKELNELFPVDKPWTEPTSASEAATVQAHQDEQKELQGIIDKGDGGFVQDIGGFIASLAGTATDPIGMISGSVAGKIGGKLISRAMGKAFLQGTARRKVIQGAIEGAAGNIVSEGVFVIPSQILEKEDIDIAGQLALAVASGAAFGGGLAGANSIYKRLRGMDSNKVAAAIDLTESKIDANKNPNLSEKELELMDRERGAKLRNEYEEIEARINEAAEDLVGNPELRKGIEEDQFALVEKGKEVQDYANEFNDQAAIRADTMSKRNDLYYDERADNIIQKIDTDEPVSFQKNLEQEVGDLDNLDPAIREEVDVSIKEIEAIESNIDELTKAAHFCLNKG